MESIKVTVIIPCYNIERFISECIDSVLSQSLKDIEVICIDDGSTDSTPTILETYKEKDSRMIVYRQKNSGVSAASNVGLSLARGEYIYLIDHDDIVAPKALKKCYSLARKYNADIVQFNSETIFDDQIPESEQLNFIKRGMKKREGYDKYNPIDGPALFTKLYENSDYQVPLWRCFFRRGFIEENHFRLIEGVSHQDVDFHFKTLMTAGRVAFCEEVLYSRRIRKDSALMTHEKRFDNIAHIIVQKAMQDFFRDVSHGITDVARSAAEKYLASRRNWIVGKCIDYYSINQGDTKFREELLSLDDNNDISRRLEQISPTAANIIPERPIRKVNMSINRLLVFSFFDPDGIADEYIKYYFENIRQHVSHIAIVCDGLINDEARKFFEKISHDIIIYDGAGYSSAAWKAGLEYLGWDELSVYDEVILADDTAFGPIFPFKEMFDGMSNRSDIDFWGITSSCVAEGSEYHIPFSKEGYIQPYIQDYFMVFGNTIIVSGDFKKFWESNDKERNISQTKYYEDLGYQWDVYARIKPKDTIEAGDIYYRPDVLLERFKLPLLERRVFENNTLDLSDGVSLSKALEIIKEGTDYNEKMIWENISRRCHQYDFTKTLGHVYVLPSDYVQKKKKINNLEKTALFMHLHYEDMIEEAYKHALKMPENADIFITTNDQEKAEAIRSVFSTVMHRTDIVLVENRGRSESALLIGLAGVASKYDIGCFWKEKKSEHAGMYAGESWSKRIDDCLFSSKQYVDNIIGLFIDNPNLGLLSPPPPFHAHYLRLLGQEWGINFSNVRLLAELLGLNVPISENHPPINPFGGAFWFRPKALVKLFNHEWKYKDFPEEPQKKYDGTLLHAIERVYPFVCQDAGYYPAYVLSDKYAGNEITSLAFIIREYNKTIIEKFPRFHSYIESTEFISKKFEEIDAALEEKAALKYELEGVYSSRTWRYGSKLSAMIRKIRNVFR